MYLEIYKLVPSNKWRVRRPFKPEMLGSSPAGITVAVAELAMLRIVAPNDAGSNPVGHLWMSRSIGKQALLQPRKSIKSVWCKGLA